VKFVYLVVFCSICLLPACREAASPEETKSADSSRTAEHVFPKLTGRVVDEANLLRPEQELDLSAKSQALEAQTGRQLVIVTVTTLNGQDPATYAKDLGTLWGIGRKSYNDGAILLVAPNERRVRIATGEGLATALPDEVAKQIIDRAITPQFRKGDMAGGIIQGTDALVSKLSRRSPP
jgi:uncharacterized protein